MLQLDRELIEECKNNAFETAIETNGTIPIDFDIDWVCVSPKYGSELVVKQGNELKTVFPQEGQNLDYFLDLDFEHLYLQPMDGIAGKENTTKTIQYCLEHPEWKLSIQQHKLIGMP
jgi:organic radical activating enzyme